MGTTQAYKEKIAEKLGVLEHQLKRYTDMGLTDEKKAMETIVCRLLNLIYGYSLVNLNNVQVNYPAIDLGDEKRQIAVQVTSTNSREKVRETIRKFEAHEELYKKYRTLIIFVTGERKTFAKEFQSEHLQFSPEEHIWDFHTLTREIDLMGECEFDKLKKIYCFLRQEFPDHTSEYKWKKWIASLSICLFALVFLWYIGTYCYEKYREIRPQYAYESDIQWIDVEEAKMFLSDQSEITITKDDNGSNWYYEGAVLTVLYHNLDDHDRYITSFSVYAENIVEDLSPKLSYYAMTENGNLHFYFYNDGWGETGKFSVDYVGMKLLSEQYDRLPVHVKLKDSAIKSWEAATVEPGGRSTIKAFSMDDFLVEYISEFTDFVRYELQFRLYSEETGYEKMITCWLYIYPDEIDMRTEIGGSPGDRSYVIWVDTSKPTWTHTYKVDHCLPAQETVRLPIFIVPEKSCTMTVRIVFETLDGELIEATPLENAEFYIPYYDKPSNYIDGQLLDWDQLEELDFVSFPFTSMSEKIPNENNPNIWTEDNSHGAFISKDEAYKIACEYWNYSEGDISKETGFEMFVSDYGDEPRESPDTGRYCYCFRLQWLVVDENGESWMSTCDIVNIDAETGEIVY